MEKYKLGLPYTPIKILLSISIFATLISCSGGSGESNSSTYGSSPQLPTPDTTPPQISSSTPAEGAVDVAIDAMISATFDESLLTSSIDTSSIVVEENGVPISGTVSEDTATYAVLFTPDTPLNWLTTYTVVVNNTITDLAGNPLDASLSWEFTTIQDNVPPTIISSTPTNGQIDVPRDQVVSAEFDEDILMTSVDDTSFFLTDADDNSVAGEVEFDSLSNSVVNFIPDEELPLLATFTANATTAITDLSGNALATDINWQFTTSDGAWSTAEIIESPDPGDVGKPQISMNENGLAFAIWEQDDGIRDSIWSSRYTPANGWEDPVLVENDDTEDARAPHISIGRFGFATAVWHQTDAGSNSIWSNRFNPLMGTWGTAETIESDNGIGALNPNVSIDADGNAIAVWQQYEGSYYSIFSNRYTPGGGWGTEEQIETENLGHASSPKVDIDPGGNAIAVWYEGDGSQDSIWSNRYTPTGGWETAELIETENAGDAWEPRVSMDNNGNAIAVWEQKDGTLDNVWANRFTPINGWEGAVLIESDDFQGATRPGVSVDVDGNAIAVWIQDDGWSDNDIWSNRYTEAAGWGTPELIETNELGIAYRPQIVTDANGNALAIWPNDDFIKNDIWSNRYIQGIGWGTPELVETNDIDTTFIDSNIAMDAEGNAIAIWPQTDGTQYNIWTNRFD